MDFIIKKNRIKEDIPNELYQQKSITISKHFSLKDIVLDRRALLIFFVYSIIYSFIFTGNSYLNLSNDISIIGLASYHNVYKENFLSDPVISDSSFKYIPSHIMIINTLMKTFDSYLFSLKIILFFQVFLSLLTNYVLINMLFKKLSFLQVISLSYLITITFVMLPFGDCVGFGGINTALPRSTFYIFLPLMLLFYYPDRSIKIFNRAVPNIIVLSFVLGLLVNIHPQSGINVFAVLLIHWTIFRTKKIRDLYIILAASIIFLATSATFLFPYIFNMVSLLQEVLPNEYIEYFWNQQAPRRQMLWLLKLTFLPFCAMFLLMTFVFRKNIQENIKAQAIYSFLKTLFIVAYAVDVISALLFGYVLTGKADLLMRPFIRTERFVFYIVELFVVFFILKGKYLLNGDRRIAKETCHQDKQSFFYKTLQRSFKIKRQILKAPLTFITAKWWIYTTYVITAITSAVLFILLIVEQLQLSLQVPVKAFIFVLTVVCVVLPPLLSVPRKINYIFSAGVVLCLFTISSTPFDNRTVEALKYSIPAVLLLFIFIILHRLKSINRVISKQILLIYLIIIFIAIPGLGITKYYNELVYRYARTFKNKPVMKHIADQNKKYDPEYLNSFDELVSWLKTNTPINASFMCIDQYYAQQFKLASKRPGIGSDNEVSAFASNSFKYNFFQDFIKVDETSYITNHSYFVLLPGIMKKYKMDYVLLSKQKNLLQQSSLFFNIFENKHFILYKLNKENISSGDYLPLYSMDRHVEGPIYVNPHQEQPAYISYRDIIISPIMKYPGGQYSINMTASGKPDLPNQAQSILTVSLVRPDKQATSLSTIKLTSAEETYTTKDFVLDSEDSFQLSFKKETLYEQTQSLQFDGIDDLVNIQLKTPLDLPEGTISFWQTPAYSSSDQTSSHGLITFYSTDGHRFEFANSLVDNTPFFWMVWRKPNQSAVHINYFNPLFKAGVWNHWAGTWKRSKDGELNIEFYLNGESIGQNTIPAESTSSKSLASTVFNRLEIGSQSNERYFKGSIAEVRLYNKILLPSQFMQIPLQENSPFLVGYWKLLGSCNQIVPDVYKNHNDGTLGLNASAGTDDPQCATMKVPPTSHITSNWLKDAMIKKIE